MHNPAHIGWISLGFSLHMTSLLKLVLHNLIQDTCFLHFCSLLRSLIAVNGKMIFLFQVAHPEEQTSSIWRLGLRAWKIEKGLHITASKVSIFVEECPLAWYSQSCLPPLPYLSGRGVYQWSIYIISIHAHIHIYVSVCVYIYGTVICSPLLFLILSINICLIKNDMCFWLLLAMIQD